MFNPLNLLKKTSKAPDNFIALAFGTTSTKALIFSLDDQVQLLGQGHGAPAEAVAQAAIEAGVKPTQAVVGLSGENVWCLTTTVRLTRPNPETEIDPKEIEKLNEQVFKTALMQATPQMSQFLGDPELNLQLVDSAVLFHKVDGQIINNALGQKGKVLECSIFTAYSPTDQLKRLAETLKGLNLNLWAVSSLMAIFVKALAGDSPSNFNAIVIDIGEKITDIAVVFGGGIWGTRPLSLGKETIERAPELWLGGVEAALADFEGIKTFPNKIIIIGGGARLENIREKLSTYPLTRALPFASTPVVEINTDIGPEDMRLIAKDIRGESNA